MASRTKINIRPDVSILSVLRNLNYTYWHALAEFVDNAVQSYLDNKEQLRRADKKRRPLSVSITLSGEDGGLIVIRDNAAGISQEDFPRAFKAASVSTAQTGLAEFGMGMKSASIWCAKQWSVRTSPLGVPLEYQVEFDITRIVARKIEEVAVISSAAAGAAHFTEIRLEQLNQIPTEVTIAKIKQHLASIYRVLLRSGELQLQVNDELLSYETPAILVAPYFKAPSGKHVTWKHSVDFTLESGARVTGFVAIREIASTYEAGLALIRHNRVIVGSADDAYRPSTIFGARTKAQHQRIFGELHLHGFDVSHTKDGIVWGHEAVEEEVFLTRLKDELLHESMPLLQQATYYKKSQSNSKAHKKNPPGRDGSSSKPPGGSEGRGPTEARDGGATPRSSSANSSGEPGAPGTGSKPHIFPKLPTEAMHFTIPTGTWIAAVSVSFIRDGSKDLVVSDRVISTAEQRRAFGLTLNLGHPLFGGDETISFAEIRRLSFLVSALCVAEQSVKDAGGPPGAVRKYLNRFVKLVPPTKDQ